MHSISRPFTIAVLAASLAACGSFAPSATATRRDDVPAAIAAPSGSRLALRLKGSGIQNYECRAKTDAAGGYGWAFIAPEAVLRDNADAIVGRHYAGPTWEYGDGSKLSGKVLADVPAPQAGNIPWLLLMGTSAPAPGVLMGVTHIQRIDTVGGVAPSDPCVASAVGTKKAVRYSADYLFYRS